MSQKRFSFIFLFQSLIRTKHLFYIQNLALHERPVLYTHEFLFSFTVVFDKEISHGSSRWKIPGIYSHFAYLVNCYLHYSVFASMLYNSSTYDVISQTQGRVFLQISENWVEKSRRSPVYLTNFELVGSLMKHFLECLI